MSVHLDTIYQEAARAEGVEPEELRDRTNWRGGVVRARYMALHIAYTLTPNWQRIAEAANLHHTTVMAAVYDSSRRTIDSADHRRKVLGIKRRVMQEINDG